MFDRRTKSGMMPLGRCRGMKCKTLTTKLVMLAAIVGLLGSAMMIPMTASAAAADESHDARCVWSGIKILSPCDDEVSRSPVVTLSWTCINIEPFVTVVYLDDSFYWATWEQNGTWIMLDLDDGNHTIMIIAYEWQPFQTDVLLPVIIGQFTPFSTIEYVATVSFTIDTN